VNDESSEVSFSPRILIALNQEIKAAVKKAALQKLESQEKKDDVKKVYLKQNTV